MRTGMTETIKPIETEYKGYRFRSRLEARWAVFFDTAHIQYQYEPEGFVLSDGTYYLPDFYLPQFHAYMEIKPESISDADRKKAQRKCELLFQKEGIIVLYVQGDPYDSMIEIYCNELDEDGGGCGWEVCRFVSGAEVKYDIDDEYYGLQHPHDYICIAVGTSDYKTRRYCDSSWADCGLIQAALVTLVHNDLQHSCGKQARMARFEHGERG